MRVLLGKNLFEKRFFPQTPFPKTFGLKFSPHRVRHVSKQEIEAFLGAPYGEKILCQKAYENRLRETLAQNSLPQ